LPLINFFSPQGSMNGAADLTLLKPLLRKLWPDAVVPVKGGNIHTD
jgi:hypothetical protein